MRALDAAALPEAAANRWPLGPRLLLDTVRGLGSTGRQRQGGDGHQDEGGSHRTSMHRPPPKILFTGCRLRPRRRRRHAGNLSHGWRNAAAPACPRNQNATRRFTCGATRSDMICQLGAPDLHRSGSRSRCVSSEVGVGNREIERSYAPTRPAYSRLSRLVSRQFFLARRQAPGRNFVPGPAARRVRRGRSRHRHRGVSFSPTAPPAPRRRPPAWRSGDPSRCAESSGRPPARSSSGGSSADPWPGR